VHQQGLLPTPAAVAAADQLLLQAVKLPTASFAGAHCFTSGLCCGCCCKCLLQVSCKALEVWWLLHLARKLMLVYLFSPCLLALQLGKLLCMKLCDVCRVQHI
jgi:hypothetical protein